MYIYITFCMYESTYSTVRTIYCMIIYIVVVPEVLKHIYEFILLDIYACNLRFSLYTWLQIL